MTSFANFTAVEIMLLIREGNANRALLFRVVLAELIFQEVLSLQISRSKTTKNQNEILLSLICGKNFDSHTPKSYSVLFLKLFKQHQQIRLRDFVKMMYDLCKEEKTFRDWVMQNAAFKKFFRQNFLDRLINEYSLTKEGEQAKKEYAKALFEKAEQIKEAKQQHTNAQAAALLEALGGLGFWIRQLGAIYSEIIQEIARTEMQQEIGVGTERINSRWALFDLHFEDEYAQGLEWGDPPT